MKIETTKPAFVPVVITIESKEELQLLTDFLGQSSGSIGELYGLPEEFMYEKYKALKDVLDDRGIPYANKIDVSKQ